MVGGGGPLLVLLQLSQVAIDGDSAARLGSALADLKPGSIRPALKNRIARIAVLGQALPDPAFLTAFGVGNDVVGDNLADDLLIGRAGRGRPLADIE